MTKKYMGFKLVDAWEQERDGREGYAVKYEDGYISWSPQETFEKSYMEIDNNIKITDKMVADFIEKVEYEQWGDKTVIAQATLKNGFILCESSSCVDPKNFNYDIGTHICRDRIYNEVWRLLGFLLQTAVKGVH